jgi:pyruvyltransferase
MLQLKRKITIVIEIILDTLLDLIIPYKALSRTSFKNIVIPEWIKFNYVFNQKTRRMQILHLLHKSGVENPKTIKAWWSRGLNNFGDELLDYLLAHIAGIECTFDRKKNIIAIGSIIRFAQDHTSVWGSGIIRKNEVITTRPKCLAVRGHLTRDKMLEFGVPCPEVYGDPAMIFPLFFKPKIDKTQEKTLIVPHFKHTSILKRHQAYEYLDLHVHSIYDIEEIIARIACAPCVATSSLHGFIFCVAYGIPVVVFRLNNKNIGGDNVKFDDFCFGIGLEPITIHTLKEDDENHLDALIDKAKLYRHNWSPIPLLESLTEICQTPTLLNFIKNISSSGNR